MVQVPVSPALVKVTVGGLDQGMDAGILADSGQGLKYKYHRVQDPGHLWRAAG